MHDQPIRARKDIDDAYKWQLEALYQTNDAWESEFASVTEDIAALPALEEALSPDRDGILHALRRMDGIDRRLGKLYAYARMRRDEDSRLPLAQAMADRAQSLMVRAASAAAFLRPALLSMPEDLLRSCLTDPAFPDHSRVLEDILRSRPHTLTGEMEMLLAQAGEIGAGPSTIYEMMTEADLTFPDIADEKGNAIEVTEGRFLTLLTDQRQYIRRDAFSSILNTYGTFGNTFAAIYAASVKNDVFAARTHHFGSSLEASLFENEIPLSVYDALLTAVHERLPALNRYLETKKRALGLDTLHLYDLYVDTTTQFDMKLSYEDAYDLVLEALSPLGDAYLQTLRDARRAGWVDVFENTGKAHGAYSWGHYDTHPFVLLNFDRTLDSASTIAHELGHAMHSCLSNRAQPYAKSGYTLFAAEVASTVNEILLTSHLLSNHPETAAQQSLLGMLLEHFRTTVFRQTLFAEFEKETHAMQEAGAPLTREALCDRYEALYKTYYGASSVIDSQIRSEWMRIPHFYRAFYVYQYATGFSAAVSIARGILDNGRPAVDGYMRFLSAGGSLPPLDALRLAGVDMETPVPVRNALQWFEEILSRFEKLGQAN